MLLSRLHAGRSSGGRHMTMPPAGVMPIGQIHALSQALNHSAPRTQHTHTMNVHDRRWALQFVVVYCCGARRSDKGAW